MRIHLKGLKLVREKGRKKVKRKKERERVKGRESKIKDTLVK